jgi:hypothetical protein
MAPFLLPKDALTRQGIGECRAKKNRISIKDNTVMSQMTLFYPE